MRKIVIIVFAVIFTGAFLSFFVFSMEKSEENIIVSEYHPKARLWNIQRSRFDKEVLVKVIFGGDMMFDRYIRQECQKSGYEKVLQNLTELFDEYDCVVANLEGPITNNISVSIGSEFATPDNYRFTFDPMVVNTLNENNVCVVNIGNNHIHNFGTEGIEETEKYLAQNDINYIGNTGKIDEKRFFIRDFFGVKIAFVNYNQFAKDAWKCTLEDIKIVKSQSDFIVVYTHWGEEYKTRSRSKEQNIAHQLIDLGVDVVIGSHPHVVQEKEIYKGKTIYYSLGNLVFDQYFSKATMQGLMVGAVFDINNNSVSFEEYPVRLTTSGITILE